MSRLTAHFFTLATCALCQLKDKHGTVKWSSGIISLDVHLGAYAVQLGSGLMPAIYDTCFKRDSLELFTSFDDGVNGMETMSPSVKLKPVPYAVHSRFADRYCGDSLHTYHIHSYWIHGYWFWGWWAVFDSIHVKKVVVDSLYAKHLFVDTIVVEIICAKKIKLDDPGKGEITEITPDGLRTAKKDPTTKEITASAITPGLVEVAAFDSTGKKTDSTTITPTSIKTGTICADSIKTDDPVSGNITSITSKGINVKDSTGNVTRVGPTKVETDTLKAKVICVDNIKGPVVVTDPNNPDNKTTIDGGSVTVDDGIAGNSTTTTPEGIAISDLTGKSTHITQDSTGKTCITNTDAGPPSKSAGIKIDGENETVCIQGDLKVDQPNGNTVRVNDNGIYVTDTGANVTWIMVEFDPSTGKVRIPGDVEMSSNAAVKGDLEVCGDLSLKGAVRDSAGNVVMIIDPATGEIIVGDLFVYNNTNTGQLHVANDAQVKGNLEVCSDLQLKGNITDTAGNPLVVFDYLTGDLVRLGNFNLPPGPPPGPNHVLAFDQFGNGQWQDRCIPCGLNTSSANQTSTPTQALPVSVNQSMVVSIDHPLDPKNKTLNQAAITSPEMLNVYNGNITTNANGDAIVKMPAYIEQVNTDFRYQLTVIGSFAQAIVFKEVSNSQFVIKTDKPNVKVSWQVTGVRTDIYARENPMTLEETKTGSAKGTLLYTPNGKVATK